jgi:hypothetical protein
MLTTVMTMMTTYSKLGYRLQSYGRAQPPGLSHCQSVCVIVSSGTQAVLLYTRVGKEFYTSLVLYSACHAVCCCARARPGRLVCTTGRQSRALKDVSEFIVVIRASCESVVDQFEEYKFRCSGGSTVSVCKLDTILYVLYRPII